MIVCASPEVVVRGSVKRRLFFLISFGTFDMEMDDRRCTGRNCRSDEHAHIQKLESGKQAVGIDRCNAVRKRQRKPRRRISVDGMTETLIESLSELPNLNVKPRSSVFRYKGKDTDHRTLG